MASIGRNMAFRGRGGFIVVDASLGDVPAESVGPAVELGTGTRRPYKTKSGDLVGFGMAASRSVDLDG
jgi:hypothetical protein